MTRRFLATFLFAFVSMPCVVGAGGADVPIVPAGPVRTWRWLDAPGSGAGARRVALLIGVGSHARHPTWDIPWVRRDLDEMERVLSEKAGFHVVRLENAEFSADAMETTVEDQLLPLLGGEGNLVLVYYTGHGYLNERGECRYFLHHTDAEGAEFAPTIGESELGRLLTPLRRDGKAKVVFLADACRVEVKAPAPRRRPRRVRIADAAIYSTRRGEFSMPAAGKEMSLFTECLTGRLETLSDSPLLNLGTVFDEVNRVLRERRTDQNPELFPDDEDTRSTRLIDRAHLTLGIQVVHGFTGRELAGATIQVAGLGRTEESPARLEGLAPGRYRIEVAAPDMFREVVEVEMTERDSGRTIEVALEPSYALLEGRVESAEGKPVSGALCRLLGSRSGFLRDYHTHEATTDSRGQYVFRVPRRARTNAVSISAGVGGKREQPIDLERLAPEEEVRGARLVRHYDLGKVILPSGAGVTVAELGIRGRRAGEWREAERSASEGRTEDLDIAIKLYERVLTAVEGAAKEKVRGRLRWCYAQLLEHRRSRGEYEQGVRLSASALEAFPGDEGFTELQALCRREAIPTDLRRLLTEAAIAVDRGEFSKAEGLYRSVAERSSELTPHYRTQVSERLDSVVDKLFLDALSGLGAAWRAGELDRAVLNYKELRRIDPEHPVLPSYERRLRSLLGPEPPSVAGGETTPPETTPPETEGEKTGETEGVARLVIPSGFTRLDRNAQGYDQYRHDESGIVFVAIPGGTFTMGGTEAEEQAALAAAPADDRDSVRKWFVDERPRHEVTVGPFLMAKHEVTQAQWRKVMGTDPSQFTGDDLPVENVSWEDCQEFCRRLGLRLPTEAQWEYACRAGTDTPVYSGALQILGRNNAPALDAIAWYGGNSGVEREDGLDSSGWPEKQYDHQKAGTHPVGRKAPNGFGLHDTIGNVWEWCVDVYDEDGYASAVPGARDPISTSGSGSRVNRGGGWNTIAWGCRAAFRDRDPADETHNCLGFRPCVGGPPLPASLVAPRVVTPPTVPTPPTPPTPPPPAARSLPAGLTPLGKNAQGLDEYRHDRTGIIFVSIPGGTYTMGGSTEEEQQVLSAAPADEREKLTRWLADERPRHEVTVSPFLIAKHEVTQAQWRAVMGTDPSHFTGDDLPVDTVSWDACQEFCRKAGLRLPTEAQWEYACRAGTDTPIYRGTLRILGRNNAPALDPIAWYGGNSGVTRADGIDSSSWAEKQYEHDKAGSHPVGTKAPNGFGLHDMIGNVWEWCEDVYDAEFYSKATANGKDPVCTSGTESRVNRGGGWNSVAWGCRSAFRDRDPTDKAINCLGFRPCIGGPGGAPVAPPTTPPAPSGQGGLTPLGKNAQGLEEFRHAPSGIILVKVPGGTFRMGSPEGEAERDSDEGPVHDVTLSPFLIAKHEVTQAQWRKVMGTDPSRSKGDDLPVEMVNWDECQEFCQKVGLRLPTEAQWEYACRAGTTGPYGGTGRLDDMGWYAENRADDQPAVGQKLPNGFGLHDMHGGVWEWCADVYDRGFYETAAARGKDPMCTSGSENRVNRGGSAYSGATECRSAYRGIDTPDTRYGILGFRPCMGIPGGASGVPVVPPAPPPAPDPVPSAPGGLTTLGKNARGLEEYRHDSSGIILVKVPGGTFRMGSPDGESGRGDDEGPVHMVTLSPFLIAKHEVTQAQWRKVMGTNPSRSKGDDLPVEMVNWDECQEFCRKTGLQLPTEAQWEYACRAGNTGPYGGTGRLDEMGWYSENRVGDQPAVGQKRPNGFGLHDMHGGVWEWCADVYDPDFYSTSAAGRRDPLCTSGTPNRVNRGGSAYSSPEQCRAAYRGIDTPDTRYGILGFRPCLGQSSRS